MKRGTQRERVLKIFPEKEKVERVGERKRQDITVGFGLMTG